MTQAYIEGFCKAAEAYGVDPERLMKTASAVVKGVAGNPLLRRLHFLKRQLRSSPEALAELQGIQRGKLYELTGNSTSSLHNILFAAWRKRLPPAVVSRLEREALQPMNTLDARLAGVATPYPEITHRGSLVGQGLIAPWKLGNLKLKDIKFLFS